MNDRDGILLESGTNEVEVLEFELAGQGFGVNVLKVQAIEQFDPDKVTEIQLAHEAVIGTYHYRDGVITLVDLGDELQTHDGEHHWLDDAQRAAVETVLEAMPEAEMAATAADGADEVFTGGVPARPDDSVSAARDLMETRIVLVLEFNEVTTGFLVDGVNRIHRVNWNAISPLSPFLAEVSSKFTGSLNIEGREILLVDMERILADILPSTSGAYRFRDDADITDDERRAGIPVLLAEDSTTIRSILAKELTRGGYTDTQTFDNGQACHEALVALVEKARREGKPADAYVGVVVSDIEMPQMDGMTLCRKVKRDLGLGDVPVILFSSLINEQIARKCESVGADAYISKPRFNELLETVDKYLLGE